MFRWGILAFGATAIASLAWLLRWILTDPEAGRDLAKERFREQQEYRAARRSGNIRLQ